MDKDIIYNYLEETKILDIDILEETSSYVVIRGYYDFDDDTLENIKDDFSKDRYDEAFAHEFHEYIKRFLEDIIVEKLDESIAEFIDEGIDVSYLLLEILSESYDSLGIIMSFSIGEFDIDLAEYI